MITSKNIVCLLCPFCGFIQCLNDRHISFCSDFVILDATTGMTHCHFGIHLSLLEVIIWALFSVPSCFYQVSLLSFSDI